MPTGYGGYGGYGRQLPDPAANYRRSQDRRDEMMRNMMNMMFMQQERTDRKEDREFSREMETKRMGLTADEHEAKMKVMQQQSEQINMQLEEQRRKNRTYANLVAKEPDMAYLIDFGVDIEGVKLDKQIKKLTLDQMPELHKANLALVDAQIAQLKNQANQDPLRDEMVKMLMTDKYNNYMAGKGVLDGLINDGLHKKKNAGAYQDTIKKYEGMGVLLEETLEWNLTTLYSRTDKGKRHDFTAVTDKASKQPSIYKIHRQKIEETNRQNEEWKIKRKADREARREAYDPDEPSPGGLFPALAYAVESTIGGGRTKRGGGDVRLYEPDAPATEFTGPPEHLGAEHTGVTGPTTTMPTGKPKKKAKIKVGKFEDENPEVYGDEHKVAMMWYHKTPNKKQTRDIISQLRRDQVKKQFGITREQLLSAYDSLLKSKEVYIPKSNILPPR